MALVLAILEVQIEGGQGWAAKLPTWRPGRDSKWQKIYKIMSGKDMTGYHLAMFSFVFLIFHLPFFIGLRWSMAIELELVSIFFLFIVMWDFLWFVVNPYFSLKNFHRHHNFWHRNWLWKLPTDYYISISISFILATLIHFFTRPYLTEWLIISTVFLFLIFSTWLIVKIFKPDWE